LSTFGDGPNNQKDFMADLKLVNKAVP